MASKELVLHRVECILKTLTDLKNTTSTDILSTLEDIETSLSNIESNYTSETFSTVKFILWNDSGTLKRSFDNVTYSNFSGAAIPANVKSFNILNKGDSTGPSANYTQDTVLDLNGQPSVLLSGEEFYQDEIKDDRNSLEGNIIITPGIGHYVSVAYRI